MIVGKKKTGVSRVFSLSAPSGHFPVNRVFFLHERVGFYNADGFDGSLRDPRLWSAG